MRSFLKLNFFNEAYSSYFKFVVGIALLVMPFGLNLSFGWLLGNLFFFLNLCLKNEYFDFILTMKSFSKMLFLLYYVASLFLLVGSFTMGFIWPQVISPYAAFVGVLGFKLFLFLSQFLGGDKFDH